MLATTADICANVPFVSVFCSMANPFSLASWPPYLSRLSLRTSSPAFVNTNHSGAEPEKGFSSASTQITDDVFKAYTKAAIPAPGPLY